MTPGQRVKSWLGDRIKPAAGQRLSSTRRAKKSRVATVPAGLRIDLVAHADVRKVITAALTQVPGMRVVSGTSDQRAAVNFAARTKPDVVVVDIDADGPMSGVVIGRRIQKAMPSIGIVLIAGDIDMEAAEMVAREFGTTWSYVHSRRLTDDAVLIHAVNSTDRSMQWVDPVLEPSLNRIWKIAADQRDFEEGMKNGRNNMAPAVQQFTAKGYEGSRPRSLDERNYERFDL